MWIFCMCIKRGAFSIERQCLIELVSCAMQVFYSLLIFSLPDFFSL